MSKFWKVFPFLLLGVLLLLFLCAGARAQNPVIPAACGKYKATLTRIVGRRLGPAAPVSLYASQMMQESGCNDAARSGAGALGLSQFMPDTANWIPSLDSSLAPADPMNSTWAMNAQVVYMGWLANRNPGKTECDTSAFSLASYNGGEGWLRRDQAVAKAAEANPSVWFGSVELYPDKRRNAAAIAENRGYPQRILLLYQPAFVAAGWGRAVSCDEGNKDGNVNELRERQGFSWYSNAVAIFSWFQRRTAFPESGSLGRLAGS